VSDENGAAKVSLEAGSLLDAKQVAELLQVPRSTVHAWAREGSLPCLRLGRHLRWTRPMIEDWCTANYDEGRSRRG
jgi:excisionase family DNA binding protein